MATQPDHKVGLLVWRGMIATVFGLTVLWSGASLTTLVTLFSAYALVDGLLVLIVRLTRRRDSGHSGELLPRGVAGIVIGGLGCLRPNVTALPPLIGAWAILIGALDVIALLEHHKVSQRSRHIAWDATIRRQRQMTWDGARDRAMRYASAEKLTWDNKSDRMMRAERIGSGWRAESAGTTAWSTSNRQLEPYS
jgi:hypothetical protein